MSRISPPQRWVDIQHQIRTHSTTIQVPNCPATPPTAEKLAQLQEIADLLTSHQIVDYEKILDVLYPQKLPLHKADSTPALDLPILDYHRYTTEELKSMIKQMYHDVFTLKQPHDIDISADDMTLLNPKKEIIVAGIDMTPIPYECIKQMHSYVHTKTMVTTSSTIKRSNKKIKMQHPTNPLIYNFDLLRIDESVLLQEPDPIVFFDDITPGDVSNFAIVNISLISYPSNRLITNHVQTVRLQAPYISSFFAFKEAPPICGALLTLYLSQIKKLNPSLEQHTNTSTPIIPSYHHTLIPTSYSDILFPDIIITDSNGTLHQYHAGLAVHIASLFNTPTFGVAKNAYNDASNIVNRIFPRFNTMSAPGILSKSKYWTLFDTASDDNFITLQTQKMVEAAYFTSQYNDSTTSTSPFQPPLPSELYSNYEDICNQVNQFANIIHCSDESDNTAVVSGYLLPRIGLPPFSPITLPNPIQFQALPWFPLISFPPPPSAGDKPLYAALRGVAIDASALYRMKQLFTTPKEIKKLKKTQCSKSSSIPTTMIDTNTIDFGDISVDSAQPETQTKTLPKPIDLPEINPVFVSEGSSQLLPLVYCTLLAFIASCGSKVPSVTTEADHCSRHLTTFFTQCAAQCGPEIGEFFY